MTFFFFHVYGLIIGIAFCTALFLVEYKAKQLHFPSRIFWQIVICECIGGLIGARAYHVLTDLPAYHDHFWQVFAIWQGGASIIGVILGGIVAFFLYWCYQRLHQRHLDWKAFGDLCVFGAPFGQAIGRLGNYVNQELYGLPTHLPWAIYIDPAHRLAGYQNFAYFHPLFLYEMILMLGFGSWVWWQEWHRCRQKQQGSVPKKAASVWTIGNGQLFLTYLLYYMFIRFWLDFLRIDKAYFVNTALGLNQVVLGCGFVICSALWFSNYQRILATRKNDDK